MEETAKKYKVLK